MYARRARRARFARRPPERRALSQHGAATEEMTRDEDDEAQAEVETDRFFNLITYGMICVAMAAPRPRGGPLVTTDQAPHRARSMRRRSSHIFNGATRNRHTIPVETLIATLLQCGRPERSDLFVSLTTSCIILSQIRHESD